MKNNTKFQYKIVRQETLDSLPVEAGGLIVTSDTHEIYADISGARIPVGKDSAPDITGLSEMIEQATIDSNV